jgi:hypothetical protein
MIKLMPVNPTCVDAELGQNRYNRPGVFHKGGLTTTPIAGSILTQNIPSRKG